MKFLIMCILVLTLSCSSERVKFTESSWKTRVDKTDVKKLYSPHFRDGRFFNPWMPMNDKGILQLIEWKTHGRDDYSEIEMSYLPKVKKNLAERIRKSRFKNYIVWLGHNSFLIKINGRYWLTDPMFSKRALLPSRKIDVPISVKELSEIAGTVNVIITHNHYDHLDEDTVKSLAHFSKFYVPLGVDEILREWGIKDVKSMDWWDNLDIDSKDKLICLPAQHWSRRVFSGINRSLWAGYLLISGNRKFYIGGDSGYFKGYREFGRKFKNIDYAFMPITAYHPRWFMHYAHVNVQESVKGFFELRAKYFVPTQWGTFKLGDNPPGYPALDLKRYIVKNKINKEYFKILNPGEILEIK